jgi:hypothetical protein
MVCGWDGVIGLVVIGDLMVEGGKVLWGRVGRIEEVREE